MNKIYILALTLLSTAAYGQIQQDINKTGGNVESNQINDIDSIRFNAGSTEMEVVLDNGNVENHTISDIDNVTFSGSAAPYPPGYVHCGTPTDVVDVTNPNTGEIWMDRNLGATQAATSSTDTDSYGDLFQWGRFADGHQCRNSATINTTSSTDDPGHGDFIIGSTDWRNPPNDNLWQGVNGINNPCPIGYRIPTEAELTSEIQSWTSNDEAGAYGSPLKFTLGGARQGTDGSLVVVDNEGLYWSSNVSGSFARLMYIDNSTSFTSYRRARGYSVRCIKDNGSQTPGTINTLDCGNANTIGTLEEGTAASGVSVDVDYTGGNGGTFTGQSITSTGVAGLTAQLSGGNFANGAGTLTYAISGTPASAGTATFPLNIGGQTCNLDVTVDASTPPTFPAGYVHCGGTPTDIVEVTNPNTGETWMDRNLGASQVATSSTDANAYGDLFQWGRFADGHQCRNSGTTTTTSSTDTPSHGDFIRNWGAPYDWRIPQNDNLWQGVNGVNNPCPSGYRIPTSPELNAERQSWTTNDEAGAFGSPLKLSLAGFRDNANGSINDEGVEAVYWSSTVNSTSAGLLLFGDAFPAQINSYRRARGYSVRCIKDDGSQTSGTINTLDCGNANTIGTLEEGTAASGVSVDVDYTGGDGGSFTGQSITSTGVTGLTAQLSGGNFANGAGTLTFAISGTPSSAGTATFPLNIGGQTCNLDVTVDASTPPTFPAGYVHCGGTPTDIVEVTNPNTGETWMDRNLGASQVATSSTDANAYGDLFQWGRFADGHQCRSSLAYDGDTDGLATTAAPNSGNAWDGKFVTTNTTPIDWLSPQDDNLWQGVNGTNNPCPSGYRIPTEAEFFAERQTFSSIDAAGAFASPLKLPVAGNRINLGWLSGVGTDGHYWVSTVTTTGATHFTFSSSFAGTAPGYNRAIGMSVRCIKD